MLVSDAAAAAAAVAAAAAAKGIRRQYVGAGTGTDGVTVAAMADGLTAARCVTETEPAAGAAAGPALGLPPCLTVVDAEKLMPPLVPPLKLDPLPSFAPSPLSPPTVATAAVVGDPGMAETLDEVMTGSGGTRLNTTYCKKGRRKI